MTPSSKGHRIGGLEKSEFAVTAIKVVFPRLAGEAQMARGSIFVIMPRCACASEVYGSVFVCVSVCLCRLLQLLKDK